ncbi:MAG: DUF4293 domain-containing protein [Dysgonamonadaceae bacterium]|jgi:4-amino-4-deoxy-L-arabinose transferase-like glycosyltransferase|nr:DUF4293 domain-containing protein [Dysgonamonadaceae bacterium]
MIQRIQTVYLILVAVVMSLQTYIVYSAGELPVYRYLVLSLCALSVILAVTTIFLYKKRSLQIKCGYVLLLLLLALLAFAIASNLYPKDRWIPVVLAVVALVFDLWAIRRIEKDDRLVKSLDRLR